MNTSKTIKAISQISLLFLLLIAGGSNTLLASEAENHQVFIKMDKGDNQDAKVDITVDGKSEAFNLPQLAVGESKSLVTQSGKTVQVTKNENEVVVNMNGQDIKIPHFSGHLGAKLHRSNALHKMQHNGVQVSGVTLTDNQKQIIKDAFLAAGIDKPVNFATQNVFVFVTDDEETLTDGVHQLEWSSNENANFEVIIKSDENEDSQIVEEHIISNK